MIKAIETKYRGYRFRSRLEARWAVFFDEIGIKYEYEPEGFELSDGTKYLPDFYLSEFHVYAEIKPLLQPPDKMKYAEQENLCAKFRDEVAPIILIRGTPWDDVWNMLWAWETSDSGGGSYEAYGKFINTCQEWMGKPQPIFMTVENRPDRHIFLSEDFSLSNNKVCTPGMVMAYYKYYAVDKILADVYDLYEPEHVDELTNAKRKAQQARFEHGETPE